MATSSTRTFPLAVSGIFFRGTELFATSSVDKLDRNENIVGYTGALVRIAGANPEPVFQSKKHGLLAGTALASGDLAVGTTDGEILVLAPDGAVRRRFPSGLMPQHSPDYLVAGGVPERLFVATKAYSNAKSERAEEWDTTTWARGKSIAFTSLGVLSVSSRGVARATGKGYTNAASWGVLEYAWKGAPKAVKTPTQRSSWCISTPAGWLVSDSKTAAFVEPSGALRWTTSEELIAGCALSDTQLALVTWKGIIVVGVADGRLTESHPLELGDEESFATPCPIAASASGTVAVASESRIFIVKRPQVTANADGTKQVAFASAPGPSPAKVAKTAKAAAKREEDDALATVVAFEALTAEILATDSAAALKKIGRKVDQLDLLAAGSEEALRKRIDKAIAQLRKYVKKLPGDASLELLHILDGATDS